MESALDDHRMERLYDGVRDFKVPLKELLQQGYSMSEVTAAYRAIMNDRPKLEMKSSNALYCIRNDPAKLKSLLSSAVYPQPHINKAFVRTVSCNDSESASLLLTVGAEVNVKDFGSPPWRIATENYGIDLKTISLLILAGADVNFQDKLGNTALMKAIQNRHTEYMLLVLSAQPDVNIQDDEGYTALMWAACYGELKTVELLLARGANMNVVTGNGNSTLSMAAERGYIAIVDMLLTNGADTAVMTHSVGAFFRAAMREGQRNIANAFIVAGVNPMLLSKTKKIRLFQSTRARNILHQAPRCFVAALMKRLVHHGFTRQYVLRELYRVLGGDIALTIYCNPVAMLSFTEEGIRFIWSKYALKYLLICFKRVGMEQGALAGTNIACESESELFSVSGCVAKRLASL